MELLDYIASTFSNSGYWFSLRNFWVYNYKSGIYVVALLSLLYIWKFGKEKEKYGIVTYYFIFYLIVMNPLLFMKLVEEVEEGTYVRLFMIFPMFIIIGITFVHILDRTKERRQRFVVITLSIIGIFIIGNIDFGVKTLPDNEYYCPNEVIEISQILHENSQEDEVVAFILETRYKAFMRQYDPSIILPGQFYVRMSDYEFSESDIEDMFEEQNIEYLVWPNGYTLKDSIDSVNEEVFEFITTTETCSIYRYIR